jgi:hypothetical protein
VQIEIEIDKDEKEEVEEVVESDQGLPNRDSHQSALPENLQDHE